VSNRSVEGLYRSMYRIRRFEETAYDLYNQRILIGPIHTYIGQEAVGVGVSAHLGTGDLVVSNHRGHGHAIAKGVPTDILLAELCGRATGCCGGKGGSMHAAYMPKGVVGSNGIVGAGLPIATGVGWAQAVRRTGNIVVAYFGDGASSQGAFHESLNLASLWKLPILFVCENNGFAVNVRAQKGVAVDDIAKRAQGYNVPGIIVDGMDVLAVREASGPLVECARRGGGPALLEAKTYRLMGHSRGDPKFGPYRTQAEWEQWQARDPLTILPQRAAMAIETVKTLQEEIETEIAAALRFALDSPFPEPASAYQHVYANPVS
jgi:TPP-dependent pyruvate/acetoin dehydrogenase alpha subunit